VTDVPKSTLGQMFEDRFDDASELTFSNVKSGLLDTMVERGSCRDFLDKSVPQELLNVLCATALASPTKSDLQQRDIVVLQSPAQRQELSDLVSGQGWVAGAPMIVIFCGNNRRQRLMHEWHGVPFANDHLDAFFNATADAAIALGAFVTAAEALGLGCCPISAVRNEARAVSDLLALPDHVFPVAGLAVGYPAQPTAVSKRLPLKVTYHVDHYKEGNLQEVVQDYDEGREATQPYAAQRFTDDFGESETYGWSADKVRQYSKPERAGFGAFVRSIGYRLE
jgi:nitroreductase/FMN reductase [NAD(P)H]